MNTVFVSGVTGAQGGAIKTVLERQGIVVYSMSRQASDNSGDVDNANKIISGGLEDLEQLKKAVKNCDAIVFTAPLVFDAQIVKQFSNNIVAAAKSNGIKKIIFNSSIPLGNTKTGFAAIDVKHDALEILQNSGLDIVTLMPTIYLDNLASPFLLPIIQANAIIPYPIASDFKFSWISLENLGRYVFAALKDDSLIGTSRLISNNEATTGMELARIISDVAATELNYIASSPDEFEQNLTPILGDSISKEISNLYRGVDAFRDDFLQNNKLLLSDTIILQSIEQWAKTIPWQL